jgi:hypothetical protein
MGDIAEMCKILKMLKMIKLDYATTWMDNREYMD